MQYSILVPIFIYKQGRSANGAREKKKRQGWWQTEGIWSVWLREKPEGHKENNVLEKDFHHKNLSIRKADESPALRRGWKKKMLCNFFHTVSGGNRNSFQSETSLLLICVLLYHRAVRGCQDSDCTHLLSLPPLMRPFSWLTDRNLTLLCVLQSTPLGLYKSIQRRRERSRVYARAHWKVIYCRISSILHSGGCKGCFPAQDQMKLLSSVCQVLGDNKIW